MAWSRDGRVGMACVVGYIQGLPLWCAGRVGMAG